MEVSPQRLLAVTEASQVGEARRLAQAMAEAAGFDEVDAGRVAIVASEAATNLVKHAREGQLLLFTSAEAGVTWANVLAVDRGPGIADVARALRDGVSTAGSAGTGLGAMGRLSTVFDLYSAPSGTALFAGMRPRAAAGRAPGVRIGAVSLSMPGESECGDGFAVVRGRSRIVVLVVDGLGHGAGAAAASQRAIAVFRRHAAESPRDQLLQIHAALRGTRGAAASIAALDLERRILRFAGIGNVAGTIVTDAGTRSAVCHHGTLGHGVRQIDEFSYPWPAGAVVVLHSDGVQSRWSFDPYPGLRRRHPMLAAGVLARDFFRGRDDATVVVVGDAA